jgi:hypothetical protein
MAVISICLNVMFSDTKPGENHLPAMQLPLAEQLRRRRRDCKQFRQKMAFPTACSQTGKSRNGKTEIRNPGNGGEV